MSERIAARTKTNTHTVSPNHSQSQPESIFMKMCQQLNNSFLDMQICIDLMSGNQKLLLALNLVKINVCLTLIGKNIERPVSEF